mgnify:CR=1
MESNQAKRRRKFCEEFDKIILDDNMEQSDKWNALIFARIRSRQD